MKQIIIFLSFITLSSGAFSQSEDIYQDSLNWKKAIGEASGAAWEFVDANPDLPNVLIVGNSISIGYTPYVRENLKGIANLYRIPENGGETRKGVGKMKFWLSETEWDIIHFNFGLHDLKYVDSPEINVPVDEYQDNLIKIIDIIKTNTNAKIIFATTSYVPEGCNNPGRDSGDEIIYNAAALSVLLDYRDILIDPHYSLTKNYPEEQREANVHFFESGKERQGDQVAKLISEVLLTIK
ncbi:MAG: SGNH/GDSL hydrolase family protein [Bacteroidales bacterium]|nr:SGNH/GDSL hydrolase family protein [Bacteroidales bacterium]